MDEKIRCFVSLDLPAEAITELKRLQKVLPPYSGTVTEEQNLHLTLKFLGDITPQKIEEVKQRLTTLAATIEPFKVKTGAVGAFSRDFVRLIWAKLEGCDPVQKAIDNTLDGLFSREQRFMGHLTIARIKGIGEKHFFLERLDKIKPEPVEFMVTEFKLKKSTLGEKFPIYEDIATFKLTKE